MKIIYAILLALLTGCGGGGDDEECRYFADSGPRDHHQIRESCEVHR